MSELPTYRPANRTTATAADVNGLFTGIGTATSAINDANVRSQGVDIAQIDTTTIDGNGRVTRFVGEYADTPARTNPSGSLQTISTWGPVAIPLRVGDILRLNVRFRVSDQTLNNTTGATGASAAQALANMCWFVGAGWLFYLEWDITDVTLSNFVPVPGQDNFGTYFANVDDAANNPVPHIRSSQTSSTLLVPHIYASRDPSSGNETIFLPADTSGEFTQPISRSRTFRYQRTGTSVTVYGVRLMMRGIVSMGIDPAGTGGGLFFVRDNILYNVTPPPWQDFGFGSGQEITIDNVKFSALVQDAE